MAKARMCIIQDKDGYYLGNEEPRHHTYFPQTFAFWKDKSDAYIFLSIGRAESFLLFHPQVKGKIVPLDGKKFHKNRKGW